MSSNNMLAAILDSVFASSLTPADHLRIERAGRQTAIVGTALMLALVGAGLAVLLDEIGTSARLGLVMLGVSVVPLLLLTLVLLPSWIKANVRKKILQELYAAAACGEVVRRRSARKRSDAASAKQEPSEVLT